MDKVKKPSNSECKMVLWHIFGLLCEMFSITPIITNGEVQMDTLYALKLTRLESSGL